MGPRAGTQHALRLRRVVGQARKAHRKLGAAGGLAGGLAGLQHDGGRDLPDAIHHKVQGAAQHRPAFGPWTRCPGCLRPAGRGNHPPDVIRTGYAESVGDLTGTGIEALCPAPALGPLAVDP